MARPRKLIPRYLEHRQSGRGRAVWTDATGKYHDVLLPGPYESAESRKSFGRLLLELEVGPQQVGKTTGKLSVAEMLVAHIEHAKRHYREPDGEPTSELREVKLVIQTNVTVRLDSGTGVRPRNRLHLPPDILPSHSSQGSRST